MRGHYYQYVLVGLGVLSTLLFGVFLYREVFPEYKIYQNTYIALEEFRSTYTGEEPPPFATGIKQIVIEQDDKGPAVIDRCISCHVALQFEHFSPTKIARDINGNIELDADGFPVNIPNEDYVWAKLDQAIAGLQDNAVNKQLTAEGNRGEVLKRLNQADEYEALKTAHVDEHTFDVTKVLRMHPLMGRETRPFEYHPVEEYGCVSCHNGNGRGLTTEKAHGPVFDGHYKAEVHADTPMFIESDPNNDPPFASVFNHKPGHDLLFQTTPLFVGKLLQARCVQCHNTGAELLQGALKDAALAKEKRESKGDAVLRSLDTEEKAVVSLLVLRQMIGENGAQQTLSTLQQQSQDYTRPPEELNAIDTQITFLKTHADAAAAIDQALVKSLGSKVLVDNLATAYKATPTLAAIQGFITDNQGTGTLFAKAAAANLERELLRHVRDTEGSLQSVVGDSKAISAMSADIDQLTSTYQEGKNLYISQGCYACHRIAGLARGGVGPELTREGLKYPWFIKESIVWPQSDLKTSTMPNFKLDHHDVEALMTFMLGQTGQRKTESDTGHKIAIQEWEAGKKLPWEKEISPALMHDLDFGMTVFATQGCAACHRLKGFESNIGFAVEKQKDSSFETLRSEQLWFQKLFPEEAPGSQIVHSLEAHQQEIDKRIANEVRTNSLLERIEKDYPYAIESLYSNFRYAARAKNKHYAELMQKATSEERIRLQKELADWRARVRKVLMIYVQQYGLGRLIGPRPNWSGIYRTDEWLMEHFKQPTAHVPRSIMPVLPFDESKFYALTYMLDVLGVRNRDAVKKIWAHEGFNPQLAYEIYCLQCHGEYMQGNGPVSAWIYPVPKNLQNAEFMRNMTVQRIKEAIMHGVTGGPMPPWGEAPKKPTNANALPVLTSEQIDILADWLFSRLPGGTVIRKQEDVPKWQYSPQDAIKEMELEGGELDSEENEETPSEAKKNEQAIEPSLAYVALTPKITLQDKTEKYFDVKENPVIGASDPKVYYIKKKYYTLQNLAEGKAYFDMNCASCHGRDADGAGSRASAMIEAKPRMLTNIGWQSSRDDLRWLRSIKYGVPGTAMQAWGDQTSAKQRMQLVMYIRSLNEDAESRVALLTALYNTFNAAEIAVENARIAEAPAITTARKELAAAQQSQAALQVKANEGQASADEAVAAYRKALKLASHMQQKEAADTILSQLLHEIAKERHIYEEIGINLLSQKKSGINIEPFFEIITANAGLYAFKDGILSLSQAANTTELQKQTVRTLDSKLTVLNNKRQTLEGQLSSPKREEEIHALNANIAALEKLKIKIISGLEAAKRSRNKQEELVGEYKKIKTKEN